MKLEGKVAVIAGGGRNIGEAISLLLSSEGAKIAIFDMDEGRGSHVAAEVKEQGGDALAVVGNVSHANDVEAMVKRVVEQWGHVDILVNCAAISDRQPILELSEETWRQVLDVTLTGTFLCCKFVAAQMVAQGQGGAIVNFSSVSAFRGGGRRVAYDAAKGGIVSMTQSVAVQLAPHKIRVNCIAPGPTGDQVGAAIPAAERSANNLLGRLTMPIDQAKVVLFLVSDDSEHIVGSTLHVGGGGGM